MAYIGWFDTGFSTFDDMLHDHKHAKNANTHWAGKVCAWDTGSSCSSSYAAKYEKIKTENFLACTVLFCGIIIKCGLLGFRKPNGYSVTRMELNTYDPMWLVCQFGCWSEGGWSPVTACEMNYTKQKYAEMRRVLWWRWLKLSWGWSISDRRSPSRPTFLVVNRRLQKTGTFQSNVADCACQHSTHAAAAEGIQNVVGNNPRASTREVSAAYHMTQPRWRDSCMNNLSTHITYVSGIQIKRSTSGHDFNIWLLQQWICTHF